MARTNIYNCVCIYKWWHALYLPGALQWQFFFINLMIDSVYKLLLLRTFIHGCVTNNWWHHSRSCFSSLQWLKCMGEHLGSGLFLLALSAFSAPLTWKISHFMQLPFCHSSMHLVVSWQSIWYIRQWPLEILQLSASLQVLTSPILLYMISHHIKLSLFSVFLLCT